MASKKKKRKQYRRRSTQEQIADLEQQLSVLKALVKEEKKFSPASVAAHRRRLELSRADYAELVDVSALTIYHWEHGHSKPRTAQLGRWLEVKTLSLNAAWICSNKWAARVQCSIRKSCIPIFMKCQRAMFLATFGRALT